MALAIAGAIIAIYANGLDGGFLLDDYSNLVDDPDWKIMSLDIATIWRALSMGISTPSGRPLAMLSFGLNYYATGIAPLPLKLTNVFFHAFNALAALLLVWQLSQFRITRSNRLHRMLWAGAVALTWALHPLLVSTVLYIVQRMELGAQACVILALSAYLEGRQRQISGHSAWLFFIISAIATIAGLGFKESALLVPGYTFFIELIFLKFLRNTTAHSGGWPQAWRITYGTGALVAFIGYVLIAHHYASTGAYGGREFNISERLLTQMHAFGTYLHWIAVPTPNDYLFYYDNYPVSRSLTNPVETTLGLCATAALAISAIFAASKIPLYSLGVAWFFVAHFLTSNIIPLELVFEHRNYSASFGLILALYALGDRATVNLHFDAKVVMASTMVAAAGALTVLQVATWSDPLKLATSLESRNPTSVRATYELGRIMLDRSEGNPNSPMFSLAIKEFERSCSLPPGTSTLCDQAIIVAMSSTGQTIPEARWKSLQRKLAMQTITPETENSLHSILSCQIEHRCAFRNKDLLQIFTTALRRNPTSPSLHTQYAQFAYSALGDGRLAIDMAREANSLAPHDPQYHINLAKFLGRSPELDDREEFNAIYSTLIAERAERDYPADMAQLSMLKSRQ